MATPCGRRVHANALFHGTAQCSNCSTGVPTFASNSQTCWFHMQNMKAIISPSKVARSRIPLLVSLPPSLPPSPNQSDAFHVTPLAFSFFPSSANTCGLCTGARAKWNASEEQRRGEGRVSVSENSTATTTPIDVFKKANHFLQPQHCRRHRRRLRVESFFLFLHCQKHLRGRYNTDK